MMHEPQSHTIDPASVLRQVWQNDYPNTWRVFFGKETTKNTSCLSLSILMLIVAASGMLTCGLVSSLVNATGEGGSSSNVVPGLTIFLLFIVIVGVATFFTIRSMVKEHRANKKLRQQPPPTLVVLPDRVVEYRRQVIRSLSFAEVAYMRLKVQANTQTVTTYDTTTYSDGTTTTTPSTSTVPAAPSVWLDLNLYNGQRYAWSIDIAPQDMIAQCILDAYNTYRVKKER